MEYRQRHLAGPHDAADRHVRDWSRALARGRALQARALRGAFAALWQALRRREGSAAVPAAVRPAVAAP